MNYHYKNKLISVRVNKRLYEETMQIIEKNKSYKFDYSFSDLVIEAMEKYIKDNNKKSKK